MKETTDVTESYFISAFLAIRPNNFSYAGLQALYSHLLDVEESTGEELELDVIAICCDYAEYETVAEALYDWNVDSLEELQDNTLVFQTRPNSDNIIVQCY